MQVDEAVWKRLTKRLAILEEQAEVEAENTANIIRAVRLLAKLQTRPAGSTDPMAVLMMGPANRPTVLPPGLSEELNCPVHRWAVENLSHEEREIFNLRARLLWELREMRAEREARKKVMSDSCVKKSPGGGAPGATLGF